MVMSHGSVVFKAIYTGTGASLDVLRGQPIKLAQVASTCLKINETSFFSLKLGLFISAGPQKYKHQIGYFLTSKKVRDIFLII